ncbi:Hpt domain-containing protein [Inquilinus limosus]|uniref:Hpt domain-containing protein n=1 Tax=Inquilinus limosus TaxID=171674 RepID=UPI003F1858ED
MAGNGPRYLFDPAALERNLSGFDDATRRAMIDDLVEELREHADAISAAAGAGDRETLALEAYALRSCAAICGARALIDLAESLGDKGEDRPGRPQELAKMVRARVAGTLRALALWRGEQPEPEEEC